VVRDSRRLAARGQSDWHPHPRGPFRQLGPRPLAVARTASVDLRPRPRRRIRDPAAVGVHDPRHNPSAFVPTLHVLAIRCAPRSTDCRLIRRATLAAFPRPTHTAVRAERTAAHVATFSLGSHDFLSRFSSRRVGSGGRSKSRFPSWPYPGRDVDGGRDCCCATRSRVNLSCAFPRRTVVADGRIGRSRGRDCRVSHRPAHHRGAHRESCEQFGLRLAALDRCRTRHRRRPRRVCARPTLHPFARDNDLNSPSWWRLRRGQTGVGSPTPVFAPPPAAPPGSGRANLSRREEHARLAASRLVH
jgi:hypothetical protein